MSMRDQIQDLVQTMIKPIRNRVYNVISRAVLEGANDSGKMQVLKISVLADENRTDVEYFQDYGFTSRSKAGAECLVVCPQGNREHMIAVKVGDRNIRLKDLGEGEVAMFDDAGNKIHLKQDGSIEVVSPLKVLITSPDVEMSGNLLVKGAAVVDGTSNLKGAVTAGATVAAVGAVTAPTLTTTGAVTGGTVVTSGGTDLDSIKTAYNAHDHSPGPGPDPLIP